jgi:hypothetical protein
VEIRGGAKTIKVGEGVQQQAAGGRVFAIRAGPLSCEVGLNARQHIRPPWQSQCPPCRPLLPSWVLQKLTSTQGVVDNGISWVEQLSL